MATVAPELHLSFCERARVDQSEGDLRIFVDRRQYRMRAPSGPLANVIARLAGSGASEDDLCEEVLQSGDASALVSVVSMIRALDAGALLQRRVVLDGRPLATLTPMASSFHFHADPSLCERRLKLSRFAYLRADGGSLRVESPLGWARLDLHDPRAAAVTVALAEAHARHDLDALFPDLGGSPIEGLLMLLQNVAALVDADDREESGNVAASPRPSGWWEFHDLLFHMRSRRGRHDAPYGGTFRHGTTMPPPLIKPRSEAEAVPLPRPDLDNLRRSDPPFADVVERRRSLRTYGAEPLTIEQVGEFLYRCARYQIVLSDEATDYALRPTPAGGALQELELYLLVGRCRGLDRGVYHYRPSEHALTLVARPSPRFENVLGSARSMMHSESSPDVYLQITARCQRVFWKYESMAYALILKNLGALYATMYLAATAMNLAPCAFGGGDSELFSTIAGLDPFEEPAIGEFVLGPRAET